MQYLVAIEKVKARMGYPPNDVGSNPAVYSGMTGAQFRAQSELRTQLGVGTASDTFFLDDTIQSAVVNGRFLLNLSNGFVNVTTAPTIQSTSKWNDTPSLIDVDAAAYVLNAERGVLQVSTDNTNQYVTVTYNYGFSQADVTAGRVPEWLEEAIITYTPIILKSSNIALPQQPNPAGKEMLLEHIMSVLALHRRNFNMGLVPI